MSTSVVAGCDCTKPLLSCSIPLSKKRDLVSFRVTNYAKYTFVLVSPVCQEMPKIQENTTSLFLLAQPFKKIICVLKLDMMAQPCFQYPGLWYIHDCYFLTNAGSGKTKSTRWTKRTKQTNFSVVGCKNQSLHLLLPHLKMSRPSGSTLFSDMWEKCLHNNWKNGALSTRTGNGNSSKTDQYWLFMKTFKICHGLFSILCCMD